MNVLFVTGIFPPKIGGPATYTNGMAHELVRRGHGVEVITLSDERKEPSDEDRPFPVHRVERGKSKLRRFVSTVSRIVNRAQWADVVYVHSLLFDAALASPLISTPIVGRMVGDRAWEQSRQRGWVNYTYDEFQNSNLPIRSELLRHVHRRALARVDHVVIATEYFREQVCRWGYPRSRTTQINNFITPVSADDSRQLPGSASNTVVSVGRLVGWKRMDVLIDTVARLSDIDLDLVVIGDGSMRETWEQYAEQRGLADRVFFIGRQSHEATLSYMAAADVFALASVWESFSIVILEAMSVHTPVVVSDIRGPDEIITDGEDGFLITPEDSAAFADTIERLLSSPELISRVVENAEETLSEYRVSGVADRVLSLFGELSESSKP